VDTALDIAAVAEKDPATKANIEEAERVIHAISTVHRVEGYGVEELYYIALSL
jgi:hypothetical protein